MVYEWDPVRARRKKIMRAISALAVAASILGFPVAVLLTTAPG